MATNSRKIDPYKVGSTIFVRLVTHHLVGEVASVSPNEVVLKTGTVMWVADDGRFTEAMRTGVFNETEIYGLENPFFGRGAVIDGGTFPKKIKIEVSQK